MRQTDKDPESQPSQCNRSQGHKDLGIQQQGRQQRAGPAVTLSRTPCSYPGLAVPLQEGARDPTWKQITRL